MQFVLIRCSISIVYCIFGLSLFLEVSIHPYQAKGLPLTILKVLTLTHLALLAKSVFVPSQRIVVHKIPSVIPSYKADWIVVLIPFFLFGVLGEIGSLAILTNSS